ncbi:MAG: DUF1508 domain-containing protein [Chitinophagaceae bacterium]|jgi:uncharacterized protein YegP (UPF0339 family)|nr:DUF1508 domain-containing protein [Bacteroidota bacterium]MBP7108883.1 DUF1508 domain-containing protein [Chitinophagaceae bacterium]MBP7152151.1 DUF1508 domain-containing protein [Paludibacteraceae bacterium]
MKKIQLQIYKSKKNGQLGWRIIAKNGKKIACGGETYHNMKDLKKALSLVETYFVNEEI